jgi:hypothetical protein
MAGRGKKKLISKKDMAKAEGHAFAGCKNNTICTLMGWGHNFLEDRPDIRKRLTQKRAERDYALRKSQTDKAITEKNPAMLIFLGKNELGQTDRQDHKVDGVVGTRELSDAEMAELLKERTIDCEDAIAQ